MTAICANRTLHSRPVKVVVRLKPSSLTPRGTGIVAIRADSLTARQRDRLDRVLEFLVGPDRPCQIDVAKRRACFRPTPPSGNVRSTSIGGLELTATTFRFGTFAKTSAIGRPLRNRDVEAMSRSEQHRTRNAAAHAGLGAERSFALNVAHCRHVCRTAQRRHL
jgi:hypothetical protein